MYHPESVTDTILLEKRTLEFALSDWKNMPTVGASYTPQIQKDVRKSSVLCQTMYIISMICTLKEWA